MGKDSEQGSMIDYSAREKERRNAQAGLEDLQKASARAQKQRIAAEEKADKDAADKKLELEKTNIARIGEAMKQRRAAELVEIEKYEEDIRKIRDAIEKDEEEQRERRIKKLFGDLNEPYAGRPDRGDVEKFGPESPFANRKVLMGLAGFTGTDQRSGGSGYGARLAEDLTYGRSDPVTTAVREGNKQTVAALKDNKKSIDDFKMTVKPLIESIGILDAPGVK